MNSNDPAETDRTNIVLICVDQWRGDALSAMGHPVVRTPHLDQLAQRGALFTRGYSATPTCVPARVALFTGQSQERHGRYSYRDGIPFSKAHPVTLQSTLREAGYQTQAIGKMHVYPERSRTGFDDVLLHDGYLHRSRRRGLRDLAEVDDYLPWLRSQADASALEDYTDNGLSCNSMIARPWDKPEALHPTNWAATQAISWLYRRDTTVPFFLYLSFHRPHSPLDPPQWAFDQYIDQPRQEPPRGDWIGEFDEFRKDGNHEAVAGRMDPDTHHRAKAGYYGHLSHIDMQINRFLWALSEFGLAENTAVVFVADHGDMLGDHDMYRKGMGYEGSAHIPFILHAPGHTGHRKTADEVVELRDVMPTLLDIAGVDIPDTVDGRSLLPLTREKPLPSKWRPELHGEHVLFGQSLQWIVDDRFKYCWMSGSGTEHLFDLQDDPQELTNLAVRPEYEGDLKRLRDTLVGYLENRDEGFVRDGVLVPGANVRSEAEWISDLWVEPGAAFPSGAK